MLNKAFEQLVPLSHGAQASLGARLPKLCRLQIEWSFAVDFQPFPPDMQLDAQHEIFFLARLRLLAFFQVVLQLG